MSHDHPNEWTGKHVYALRDNALRLTQTEFAERVGMSPFTISKYERLGEGFVLAGRYAKKMDQALAALTDDERRRFRDALAGDDQTVTLDPGIDGVAAEEVDLVALGRRGFLLGMGIGIVPAALTSQWLSSTGQVPAWLAEGLRSTAATYRAAYRMAPAAQLLASAHSHMQLALALRPGDQPESIRTHLLTTVGEMAALAGIILGLDLGDWRNSAPYLHLAQHSARESGNPELQAVVMACHAFQAAYNTESDLQLGLDYAEAAQAVAAQGASPITRGWVAAVASERHADLGDSNASLSLLDQARIALDTGPVEAIRYSGIGAFDTAKLTAYEGSNYRRMGEFNKAVNFLDAALAQLDPSLHRHRATALIDRAEAHRDAHRIDAACADTRAALVLVAATGHTGTLERAVALARSVRHTQAREARDLWNDALATKTAVKTAR
ncbi:helix-turn-helix domain-containing protein [Nocardia abscessus]|uniref:helix-turn-helix domain-containing protein n=1 Tax=Nocardia abscessus TaxID=120957 RepID=UPI002455A441|nr:helix-turn-helix transcriptional regulator [Nocardia abscessus]